MAAKQVQSKGFVWNCLVMPNGVSSDERTNLEIKSVSFTKKVCNTLNPEMKQRVRTEITHLTTKLLIWMVA
jgi:hypothetical protein